MPMLVNKTRNVVQLHLQSGEMIFFAPYARELVPQHQLGCLNAKKLLASGTLVVAGRKAVGAEPVVVETAETVEPVVVETAETVEPVVVETIGIPETESLVARRRGRPARQPE